MAWGRGYGRVLGTGGSEGGVDQRWGWWVVCYGEGLIFSRAGGGRVEVYSSGSGWGGEGGGGCGVVWVGLDGELPAVSILGDVVSELGDELLG